MQALTATLLGAAVGLAAGWGFSAGLVFGLAISVASTVVLLRVLADAGDLHTPAGHVAVGWLVVEDLLTVFVLVVLPAVLGGGGVETGGLAAHPLVAVPLAVAKVAALVVLVLYGGGRLIPWVLARAAATRSRELFTLTVLVLALGIAVGSAKAFGVSMALGAFLAGMVVGRSEFSFTATEALPMRDAFAVLFFVSVGMLFDPQHLTRSPGLVAATLAVILLGKPLAALAIVRMLGHPLRTAVSVAVALSQIGEFSFILAAAGQALGILDDPAVNTIIAAAIVSITLNPLYYRLARPIERALRTFIAEPTAPGLAGAAGSPGGTALDDGTGRDRVVVVGYGPVGRTLVRLLRESQFQAVVIELNHQTARRLADEGVAAVYGDAAHRETLEQAGLRDAVALVFSSSQTAGTTEAIHLARELIPRGLIAARANYLLELPALQRAGADLVFAGEGEVALSMTGALLERLGATPEQIDRERDRIRADLFDRPQAEG